MSSIKKRTTYLVSSIKKRMGVVSENVTVIRKEKKKINK